MSTPLASEPAPESRTRPTDSDQRSLLTLVLQLVRPYHRTLALVFAAMFVEMATALAAPWPLKVVIDNVLSGRPLPGTVAWLPALPLAQSPAGIALFAAMATVVITAVGEIAGYIDSYFTERVGQSIANDLRMKLYHHLHRLSLTYYDHHQTGAILSTMTEDVATIQSFGSTTTLSIFIDLITLTGMLVLMFFLNWSFALIALLAAPFLLVFVIQLKTRSKRAAREVRKRQSDLLAVVQQGLESVRTVEAFGREDLEEQRLGTASRSTLEAALKARRIKSLLSPSVELLVAACTGFVLWNGARLILAGDMSVGTLTVFLAYLSRFFKPVQDLAKMTNAVAQASVALERVSEILNADTIVPERPGARDPGTLRGDIAFEHVTFAYDGGDPILRDVTFSIASGERVGIVGPTGCGKSTVVSLLPRFYDATGGSITVDGVDVRDFRVHGLREQIGFVLQDTVLFRGTVRDNIAYGRPDATDREIVDAARLTNAHEFIMKLPMGYDSMVGERGLTLSGGQRQLLGITRAVIRNAPILVLDEPTAALDAESEQAVMAALERLMRGRTVITIAHRLSTVRDTDRIFVLSRGEIAEQGTHEELVRRGGLYADLYGLQAKQWPDTRASAYEGRHRLASSPTVRPVAPMFT